MTLPLLLWTTLVWGASPDLLKDALKRLSPAPSGGPTYPHAVGMNLIRTLAEEKRVAQAELPKKMSKHDRQQHLFQVYETRNREVSEWLSKDPSPGKADAKTIQEVFVELSHNPISKVDAVTRYDKRGDVGFCFGRALMVHYQLLGRGVPQSQMAKIFAVGKIRYKNQLWDFHMATLVKATDGKWWVIDSLFEKPIPASDWMRRVTGFGVNRTFPEVRFYVTDPRKFQPSYPEYRLEQLTLPDLRPYFDDLFTSLR